MKHRDLGRRDGPLVLFGGPYSNLQATEALIAAALARGISADGMICTGDVVAYCGRPAETVALLRGVGCLVVAGNFEIQLATGAPDCGCGFEEGTACDLLSDAWYAHAQRQISQDARDWMGHLPDILSFHHHGARYAVIHGGVSDVARFVWETAPPEVFAEEWELIETAIGPIDHVVAGHSGLPFAAPTHNGSWINAGVIGMPPHDGDTATRYAVLDRGTIAVEWLNYDVAGAVADMKAAGLPAPYRHGLQSGYWPSEDVLPPELRLPASASG